MNRKEFELNSKTLDLIIDVTEKHFELPSKSVFMKSNKHEVVQVRKFVVYFGGIFTQLCDTEISTHLRIKNLSRIGYYRKSISTEIMVNEATKLAAGGIQSKIKSKILTEIAPKNQLIEFDQPIALRKSPSQAVVFSGLNDKQIRQLKSMFENWSTVVYPNKLILQN